MCVLARAAAADTTPVDLSTPIVGENGESCGALRNGYGPYDYTDPDHKRNRLPIVEREHFSNDIYLLRAPDVYSQLDYTLRAFPNHHLALDAMARLFRQHGPQGVPKARYSIDCWFERARAFQPEDGAVPLLYGIHLFALGRLDEAETELLKATELMPNSAEANYNLGLLYARLKSYPEARKYAERAYSLGFPLPGLRDQLRAVGEWSSTVPAAAP